MSADVHFVPLANFPNGFEADMARQQLEDAGIPVLVKALQGGMFGPGYLGPLPGGVTLLVPSPDLESSRDLLGE